MKNLCNLETAPSRHSEVTAMRETTMRHVVGRLVRDLGVALFMIVAIGSCKAPFGELNNPMDPESRVYMGAPSDLAVSVVTQTRVDLSWVDNARSETGFTVERKDGVEGEYAEVVNVGADATGYSNTGLSPLVTYIYRVRAFSPDIQTEYCAEVSVTTLVVVTLNAQGGAAPSPATTLVTPGTTYGTLATTTRDNFTFAGWWTGAGGTGSQVTAATTVATSTDHTLYAKWTGTVTFNGNGSTGGSTASLTIAAGQSASLTANGFTRPGYAFSKWNTQANGSGTNYSNGASYTMSAGNVTLYAQWLAVGSTWTQRTLPSIQEWRSVTYGNGVFVAVSYNSNVVATSPNGITWTQRTLPSNQLWTSVTFGNGLFVVVAYNTSATFTSPDGINWTLRWLPTTSTRSWSSVTYGNGVFAAVSSDSSAAAATSPDGITWTLRTLPSSRFWVSVTYGNGVFVAVAHSSSIVATSPDGITWTQRSLPSSQYWNGLTYGNGVFVVVASNSTVAATSPDGITWTQRTLPSSQVWQSVTYGNGVFVAVVYNNSNVAATSPDGITWTQRTLPSSQSWLSVTYGNGVFVAVAYGSNVAATSP